ncbi:oligopeptide/dipeptide ABC transporter ATP-binding protein [Clostridium sp. AM58-1XD]|uniref:ABC transporter ATP-binding protein n=1 Tax=Clostridium sp. AM58-1XD TaxID=2292307 RepID=UPI000E4F7768|nr:oligopeptide/dipeptide ABC transporter ATP-binding protein [Clostridium sp. AM58-1XD]RGY97616.1 ATP-binding cassette domain-containing protein [Clostridium sp. AM58-1XD]
MNGENRKILLEARQLVKEFPLNKGRRGKQTVHAVSDVSLKIYEGETMALVGESGCGKSTLGRLLIRLIPPTSGEIIFEGENIERMSDREFGSRRRQMQIIFQDPYASLNPRMSVKEIIAEPLVTYGMRGKKETEEEVLKLMDLVGIPRDFLNRYPHQFSGGQRQRIGIARAIALRPKLIICDEPVSALDVSIQSQVLNLLKDLQEMYSLTYLFISHDLSVVKFIADRVCVMFLGSVCEIGETEELYDHPLHPYTKFLLEAIPKADPRLRNEEKEILSGEIPSPVNPPSGCRFHTRCPYAQEICSQVVPNGQNFGERQVFCHFPLNR